MFLVFGILLIGATSIVLINRSKKEVAKEEAFFQSCSTTADYREYLSRYPDGKFVVQASDNIQKMRADSVQEAEALYRETEQTAFNNCSSANLCRQYLKEFPNGSHVSAVIIKLEQFVQDSLKSLQPSINDDIDYRIQSFIESYSRLTETSDRQLIHNLVSKLFAPSVKRYFNVLLSGKTQKDILILLEALYNRTSSFLFQKVSPPNQKGLVPVVLFVALWQGCSPMFCRDFP